MGYNDEIKIFNGIVKGNEKVLKDFYERNFTVINSFIIKNSGTERDSEDIFQDALIILYQKLKSNSLVINCSIHTYFYGVCKNMWRTRLRKKSRISYCNDIVDDLKLEDNTDIIKEIEQSEREKLFRKHFVNLNCKCKQILSLFLEGKSMREIGLITGHSEGYVRKKKFESKKQLLEMIEKDSLFSELMFISKPVAISKEVS
ncbi:sigma-70 family RNA polymerase sigma factor [uncultured Aquimarina sp.]|uniref:RNA polymerase sigma factor n=1 Tax=uncultured Aquimarina sp. TaxID=575652 RepID=UPI00261204B7|nr:sigma-70 family RNA polymerase sigma factor [uncultured Aquimarina sp.]